MDLNAASYPDLKGKVVLITGGANGIGESMVRAFAAQGCQVHFCDVDEEAGKALAKDLGDSATFRKLDLRKEVSIKGWIKAIGRKHNRIDVLINNAARDPRIALGDATSRDWDDLFALNLLSMFLTLKESTPWLEQSEQGSVINFSSITVHLGPEEMTAYVATQAGIQGLTRSAARELGPKGIRVNTLSPGWIMTDRQLKEFVTPAVKRQLKKEQCLPGLLQPEQVANVALFLASQTSSGMTGQELLVDHGWRYS